MMLIRSTPVLFLTILVGLLALSGAARAAAFTFPDAEFMPGNDGTRAARSFMEDQLTHGLPMSLAIARVEKARASCHVPAGDTEMVTCEYFVLAHPVGGDLGENIWTVHLIPDSNGTLDDATIARTRAGMPGYLTTTASLP
jgi:hypothetical protein